MSNGLKFAAVCVACGAIVAAAFAFTGRYHVTTVRYQDGGYVMMVDRFTGAAYGCEARRCWRVEYRH
jgi:hypothetical protein